MSFVVTSFLAMFSLILEVRNIGDLVDVSVSVINLHEFNFILIPAKTYLSHSGTRNGVCSNAPVVQSDTEQAVHIAQT